MERRALIKKWDYGRGFNFIQTDAGGDLSFHISEVRQVLKSEITVGTRVQYHESVSRETKWPCAVAVRVQKKAGNGLQSVPAQDHEEPNDGIGNRDGPQPAPPWLQIRLVPFDLTQAHGG